MKAVAVFVGLFTLQAVRAQLSILNLVQCGNLNSGVCRLQCQRDELSVYPYTCTLYSVIYGGNYQRCVTSMPCCYWSGICRTSCPTDYVQLSSAATCDSVSSDVCCVPSSLVGSTTPTVTTATTATTTATTTTPSVATRQGVCGSAVTSRASAPRTGVRFRPDPRIIGGTVAQATDWPWMVRLTFTTSIGFCAGVLVDDDTVVTVAHCVAGVNIRSMQVVLGDYDISTFDPDEEVVDVASSYVVSSFIRGTRGNDFAVLKLARNVRFTDRKLPACLPDPTIPLGSQSTCYIAGWGISEQGVGGPLRAANVRMLDRSACEQRLSSTTPGTVTLPSDIVCTDNPASAPTDGCLFDDGDMLVCLDSQQRWSLVGVMSEYSCGGALPILFTDVRNYTGVTLDQL